MGTKLYVGNLAFTMTEGELEDLFRQVGDVTEVQIIFDKFTNKSRGFAFVTMATDAAAAEAVNRFHGQAVEGRALYFARGSQLFQAVVYAPRVSSEAVETFFSSFKFP